MSIAAPTPGSALAQAAAAQSPDPQTSSGAAYHEVVMLSVGIILFWLANKTAAGHSAVYYGLLLLIVLMLVTQYRFIQSALTPISHTGAPISTPAPSSPSTIR